MNIRSYSGLRWVAILVGALAVLWITIRIWMPGDTGRIPHPERPEIDAEVITPVLESIPILREATGIVTSKSDSLLASKIAGLVEEIWIQEGDGVKAGQILILLDNRDLMAQQERSEADLQNASIHFQRMKQLYQEESVAKQELDNAERALKVAEAALKSVKADLSYTVIRAPFDGIVIDKKIELGELATPGRSLLRLVDHRHLRLEASVTETDIGALKVGDLVRVRLDALEETIPNARIAQIIPSADPSTHSFLVKADLPYNPRLKSGLFGRMIFTVGSRKALIVPKTSVWVTGGLTRVYVVDESGILRLRLVKLGKAIGEHVEILSGLDPGERIIVNAARGLEGASLRNSQGNRK